MGGVRKEARIWELFIIFCIPVSGNCDSRSEHWCDPEVRDSDCSAEVSA
ncbi:unnamed protein product [Rhodiola kirilowii]